MHVEVRLEGLADAGSIPPPPPFTEFLARVEKGHPELSKILLLLVNHSHLRDNLQEL